MRHRFICFYLACLLLPEFVTSQTRPTNLRPSQKYPDKDESAVCGRIRDTIPRNSGRFRKILIRNTNDLASYANDDCRRMTSRTKSKLDILASLVRSTWSGRVKVKVLLAWTDQNIPSDKTSLHYEGRSLRLQLSNGERSKLGYLAGLALEAGFDWVHYVDVNYIRASVIPDVCQTSVDMVFLLDESGSVGKTNFGKVKQFVQKVIDFFNVGKTGTHIAVVTYSTNTRKQFNLNSYHTKLELRNAVSRIRFRGGYTYTGEALDIVRTDVFIEAKGMRTDPGIPKVLVLLTDGKSNGKNVLVPANALRNRGINIFSIGVGHGVSKAELNLIASDPDKDYVFELTSFNDLSSWVDRLSSVSCSEGSLIKSCEKSVTTVTSGSFKYFRTEFNFVTGNRVSVEVRDKKGISHLYASSTSKNPGPLDPNSEKNENDRSPRAVSVILNKVTKTVYVAVQGQEDINEFSLSFWDNLFSKSIFNVNVKEGLVKEFSLELLSYQYSLQYSITDGNNEGFFMIAKNLPKIFIVKPLDRETTSEYNLVVVAQDNKHKCRKSRTLVVVKVLDENDNAPQFTENPYRATIKENTQIGTVVKTVKATDKDVGKNAQITYSITSGNSVNLFRINNLGQVILQDVLDYENEKYYSIDLKAEDGGNPRKSASSQLKIIVSDVNEIPTIRCKGSCSLKVPEDAASGTVVGTVIGTDPEITNQCSVKYDINPSGARNTFQISPDGDIRTKVNLDRELTPQYVFFARVNDCGSPTLSASVKVTVTVSDVNDNDPMFNLVYNVGILENEAVGSKVVQVKADDADTGNNGEVRYSLSGHDSSIFKIDAVTGLITTKSTLDYETKKLYKYNVVATDKGASPRTAKTTVTVNIRDVNDNKPAFTGLPYRVKVKENASIGTLVKIVSATDDDSGRNGEIIFSIISGNIGNAFVMNSISGIISINSNLDRETRSLYYLVIRSLDLGSPSLTSETTVKIIIEDVNDNSPVFHGIPYRASVSENSPVKQLILKVSATDKDIGQFGKISYSIKPLLTAQHIFQIDSSGNIHLKTLLDYEKQNTYTFVIAATDGGGKESTANVAVFIEDFNDNAPIFNPSTYNALVAENVGVGHFLKVVTATDKDSGPRGRITYSITNGNVGSAFRCSADGSVTVASLLDRETLESYTLTIKASDNGISPQSSTTEMVVNVTDVNDNKPTFHQISYSFRVSENNFPDHEVGKIGPATDKDKDNNAKIVYSIKNGDLRQEFNVDSSGKLIAKKSLDHEITSSYNLEVEARDKGSPPLHTWVPVEVIVEDVNDNTPKFSKKIYNCQISENSAENTPVCFIRASDKDHGRNGVVTYELVVPSGNFSVNQKNGEIKAKVTFDREQIAYYSFVVHAKDNGIQPLSSNATVNVKVIDKNDNEPVFKKSKYSFDVSEDAAIKIGIGQVVAEDQDEGSNGQVVYSIFGGNTNTAFEINANTGVIQVKSLLDREKLANYKLDVIANDRGRPSLFSNRVVLINVKDVNDNSPVFTKSLYNGIIAEDASRDSAVVQVAANDPDEGNNGKITYKITGGQNRSHFSIEGDTGWIRTAHVLDYERKNFYMLDVIANDGGNPSRSNTSRVNITVTNTNDNVPTFVPGSSRVSVSEGVAIGTNVVKFNATDQDGSPLNFSISSGNTNDSLKIDSQTGLLTTNKKLDREKIPWYNLTVTVKDEGAKSSSRNLSVIVLDVNDNAPEFKPSSYKISVKENTPAGSVVKVTATDIDEGQNAKIYFSIDRTSSKKFTINSATGVISSKTAFDYEQSAQHIIQVTASDAGTPSLSSVATVEVDITDTNDNTPNFKNDYSTTLRENTAKGRTVLRVEATDPDSGEYGEIQYNIISGNGFFSLGVKDGILKVQSSPDRETVPSFTLTIVASNKVPLNGAVTPTKTSCTVNITIEDVNDNAPIITNNVSRVNVQENSKSPTPVFNVKAVDKDIGANGAIQYKIVSGNVKNAFTIDLLNGEVSVNGSLLDRETLDFYTLKIRASDKGTPILFSEKDFTVNVTDEDDNFPVFMGVPYYASVIENSSFPTLVFHVKATDKDIGVNGKIAYSISSGNNEGHFLINEVSGRVSTNAFLDYEAVQNYDLVVSAKDTKHTVPGNLSIRVVNINDNSPVFNPTRYDVSIAEDSKLYYHFLTLNATDKDPFGSLTYTIVSGNNAAVFTLDSSNGQLRVASQLDRETTDFYNLTVSVTDGGKPALSDLGFVQVHITDSNDNAPKFNSSSEQTTVLENSKIGVTVLRVEATDRDLGVNAKLQYNIIKGNEENKFKLNCDTGDLRVNGSIDRETTSYFYLDIVARDQGSPFLTSGNLRLEIVVVDENDNDPEFEKKNYYQNITENLLAGVFVEQIKATDKDLDLNGKVVYSIKSGGRGHFTIGNETGIIGTIVPLDRESISSYSVVIEASDLGSPHFRQSTVNLSVNVLDTNDNAPQFLLPSFQGNATEEGPKEQFVTRIFAIDSDEGRNAEIEYKLATQRAEQILKIDKQTGVIRTRVTFDYEEQDVHTFKVTAFDKGNPSLSTTTNLTINVIDIDDNCPEFNPKEYNVTIRENLLSNYTIVRVTATDKDSVDNKGLDYGIRSGNEAGTLAIDPVSGNIRSSNSDVDREYSDVYSLVVRAGSDYCGVNASDTDVDETTEEKLSTSICKVNIFVTDVNDNPPRFLKPSYSHVFSDIYQTSLLWLNATDPDLGVNAEVYFAPAGVERVDSQRTLTVKAMDRGQPSQTSYTTVVVTMAEGVVCEAMFFDVSLRGHVTVKTLCIIDNERLGDPLVGEAIKFDCGAKGNTNPEYRWTRNSVPVTDWSKTGAFEIKSLTKDDAGRYFCIASSDAGTILSDPIELIVKESPMIIVHPMDTWAGIGERAALHCLATGDQPMQYTWYKNNKILYSTEDLITNEADLVFEKVIPEDAEKYYCEAKNSVKNKPARSKKALLQVYSADSVIEMVVSADKPRHKESCQYFNIKDLKNVVEAVVDGKVEVTEVLKPETTCNVTHCSSDPCQNQGKCLITKSGFVCQCLRGWEGTFCEQDVDECNTESCTNGTCQNRRGSYSCDCKPGSNGKRCQLSNNVCKNHCFANQTCYPKETLEGYECINNVKTVSMVIKLDESRRPWENWMKYDVEREIENAIVNKWQIVGKQRSKGKRRRSIEAPDYSACSVIISKTTPTGETEVRLETVLVCSSAPTKSFVCQAMFDEGKVSSCIAEGGSVTETPPTQPPTMEPVRLTVLFFVRTSDEEEMDATEAVSMITESDIDNKLKPHGIKLLSLRARKQTKAKRENSDKLSPGAIAGVAVTVIVVSLVLIAIAILVLRSRKRNGKEFGIEGRAVLSRNTSNQAMLTENVSMRELKHSESRGINNRTFSEIYEESENNPKELEDGSFMFDNPQISTRNQDGEYMDELHSSPWYHGPVSRSKAEELLGDGDNEGSFIVRVGLDAGEFYISVRAPKGGPKFRHIAVNRRGGKFVAVCGPSGDTVELPTFHELVEYLRSTPTRSEGVGPDILLKDYVEKK